MRHSTKLESFKFPVLTGHAKQLFIKAYGVDIYDDYANNFNALEEIMKKKIEEEEEGEVEEDEDKKNKKKDDNDNDNDNKDEDDEDEDKDKDKDKE